MFLGFISVAACFIATTIFGSSYNENALGIAYQFTARLSTWASNMSPQGKSDMGLIATSLQHLKRFYEPHANLNPSLPFIPGHSSKEPNLKKLNEVLPLYLQEALHQIDEKRKNLGLNGLNKRSEIATAMITLTKNALGKLHDETPVVLNARKRLQKLTAGHSTTLSLKASPKAIALKKAAQGTPSILQYEGFKPHVQSSPSTATIVITTTAPATPAAMQTEPKTPSPLLKPATPMSIDPKTTSSKRFTVNNFFPPEFPLFSDQELTDYASSSSSSSSSSLNGSSSNLSIRMSKRSERSSSIGKKPNKVCKKLDFGKLDTKITDFFKPKPSSDAFDPIVEIASSSDEE